MRLKTRRASQPFVHGNAPASLVLAGALLVGACDGRGAAGAGELYVTSGLTDEVVRLDARDGTIIRRIQVDRLRLENDEPHAVAVAPDGRHWYVTVAHGQPSLWKFETDGDRLVGRLDLPSGGAAMIGMTPDGAIAYIPDYDRAGGRVGRVASVRLHDLSVIAHAEVCGAPHDAAVDAAGATVAIACSLSDEVVLLDSAGLTVRRRLSAPGSVGEGALGHDAATSGHMPMDGARPMSLAWSPDGALLAVALHAAGTVWVLDRGGVTRQLIRVDAGPSQVVFLDRNTLVTANRMGGSLSVVDLESGTEVKRLALDVPFPHGLVLSADRRFAFVSYEGTPEIDGGVVAMDLESGDVAWRREAGRYVLGIAFLAN